MIVKTKEETTIPIDLNPIYNTIKFATGVKTVVIILIICKKINLSWQVTTAVYGVAEKLIAVLIDKSTTILLLKEILQHNVILFLQI